MNEADRIEEALKKLEPGEVRPHLMARLTAARPQAGSRSAASLVRGVLIRWLLPIATSACVALGTFLWLEHSRRPAAQAVVDGADEPRQAPVVSQDFLVAARPVGIVVAPNQRPYRIMDVEWMEWETLQSATGGPPVHTATKRRDVIPVALELY